MKVLVVGGGGREHAIVWKLSHSSRIDELYCAPGNGGIAQLATCVPIAAMDIANMKKWALENAIDLVVVAPDDPLAAGMVDAMNEAGIRAFGPTKAAARIESSKAFSKDLMAQYHIPTAAYRVFRKPDAAMEYVNDVKYPIWIKTDGLAVGKGAIQCKTKTEAQETINQLMVERIFKDSGSKIVIEEPMSGKEVSLLCFVDGTHYIPMVSAMDYKRIFDNDQGLNTGGMGSISPAPQYTDEIAEQVEREIIRPVVSAMAMEGCPFKGVLYVGLMLTPTGPKVIEFNARFGDPEAQVVLPRMKSDLLDVFEAVIDGRLAEMEIEWSEEAAVCVVAASEGYPSSYETGKVIEGLETLPEDVIAFHAGTKKCEDGVVTAGGRVLGLTAMGSDLTQARDAAYAAMECVRFERMHFRTDIGGKV